MAWNPQAELVKHAADLAKKKHAEGFNKAQLVEASKEVFGGFGADPRKPIKTMEDVGNAHSAMVFIDGHYPASMSSCQTVGINGGCGYECPVFLDGSCHEHQEGMLLDLLLEDPTNYGHIGPEDPDEVLEIFKQVGEDFEDFLEAHEDKLTQEPTTASEALAP
jgi:hypothetical protein